MNRVIIAALTLISAIGQANANAFHFNPSQRPSQSMQTFGQSRMPIGYARFCQKYADECTQKEKEGRLQLTEQRWRQMLAVNFSTNTDIAPRTDMEIYGVEEAWEIPTVEGDCEDYALLKKKRLEALGFPASSLLMTVGLNADRGGHAVLTVTTDRGDFVLDNLEAKILSWKDTEIYYLKRQSPDDPNRWENLFDPAMGSPIPQS